MKYFKSVARLLNRAYVNREGLDLSKAVLCISVGQRAAELPAVKVGAQKKYSASRLGSNPTHPRTFYGENSFQLVNTAIKFIFQRINISCHDSGTRKWSDT